MAPGVQAVTLCPGTCLARKAFKPGWLLECLHE